MLFGDGQSDFGSSTEVTSYGAWGLCTGDFDGDGWWDLAATSYGWAQHAVRPWRNDHLGGFTSLGTVSTLASPSVDVISGDFNGDGRVDLAAIREAGGYAVDWFAGNGTARSARSTMCRTRPAWSAGTSSRPSAFRSPSLQPTSPLLGLHLYLQAYAFAPGQNAAEMITSNGIAGTFGNL